MRKEVESTEEAIFCDVCGKQIADAHWSYGGYATAEEETKECFICGRDTCPNCRDSILMIEDRQPWRNIVCKLCQSHNMDTLEELKENRRIYDEQRRTLERQYIVAEHRILKKLKPANKEEQHGL